MCAWPALQCQEPDLTIFSVPIGATEPSNPDSTQTLCSDAQTQSRTMSSYAHLSEPDPEFAAHLKQHPPLPFSLPDDVAAAQQGWIEHNQARFTAIEKGRLRPGQ